VAALFLHGQAIGIPHTHEHSHEHQDEPPTHSSCEVYILAIEDDNLSDLVLHINDVPDVFPIWTQLDRLALFKPELAPGI